jgi:acetoin utilization deacetylase AcuC-like enzyme
MNVEKSDKTSAALPVLVVKDRRFLFHLEMMPHMESDRRMLAAISIFYNETLDGRWREIEPRPALVEELAWIHTAEHIERVAASAGKPLTSYDLDTQATAKSYDTARLAVGSVFTLIDEIWKGNARRGAAFIRPPGHHAEPDRVMGFCLFNNTALGAAYLHKRCGAKRVMIVDIDAHHGNGTQTAFYDTDRVLYVSMHQFPGYPGTGHLGEVGNGAGEGYTVNIPLGKGCGDYDFARMIHFLIAPLARAYGPDIILVSCGFDLYFQDRLCGMGVTPEGYALMTFLLIDMAEQICKGRILFFLEGGYSLRGIRECGLRVMQELCDVPTLTRQQIDKVAASNGGKFTPLKKVIEVQRRYWKHLC